MGKVELGAIVVDMDEFWAQEETVGVRFMWLFLKAWAMKKSVARVVLRHTIHRDALRLQRTRSQEELDLNLNFVYNVCDTWRLLHDS